jgi:hypothetical protein
MNDNTESYKTPFTHGFHPFELLNPVLAEAYKGYKAQIIGCIFNPPIGPGWGPSFPGPEFPGPGGPMPRPWRVDPLPGFPYENLDLLSEKLQLAKEKGKPMEGATEIKVKPVENGFLIEIGKKIWVAKDMDEVMKTIREELEPKAKS